MAALRIFSILAIVALASGADPRPTLEEYEKDKAKLASIDAAKKADDKKKAAVDEVIELLTDLKDKVLKEGEEEARTYNKFACWCKETSAEKTEAITEGTSMKESLTADINKDSSDRDTLDGEISAANEAIAGFTKEMQQAAAARAEAGATYEKNAADLTAAIEALEGAIQVLKASKPASFIQLQGVAKTVQKAMIIADALGLASGDAAKHAVASLLQEKGSQAPEVEMEDYKFHSDGIIGTLEKLLKDFVAEKNTLNSDEVKEVQAHSMLMQEKGNMVKAKKKDIEEAEGTKASTTADIERKSAELTITAATLLDDQAYIQELAKNCNEKAKTWTARSQVRADELSALVQAIAIIEKKVTTKTIASTMRLAQQAIRVKMSSIVAHSPKALEAIEAEAEAADDDAPVGFLQRQRTSMRGARRSVPDYDGARMAVAAELRSKGTKLKSAMLGALAAAVTDVKTDVFAKIKTLIQDLIDKLLKEEATETSKKGYCDKAQSDATQQRDYSANDVAEINSNMAELESTIDGLNEKVATLQNEKKLLEAAKKEAEDDRAKEKEENEKAIGDAKLGIEGVSEAIDLLDKWYKTNAKNTVDLALLQGRQPDAPDAGFESGEAYKGAFADAGGVIGMLEVIKSDFIRTVEETEKAEAEAAQAHFEFITVTAASLAEKSTALKQYTTQLNNAIGELSDAEDLLKQKQAILEGAVESLISFKAECIDTGMSYNDRVANREEEIASLKQALCILNSYKDFAEGGSAEC